jgi:hypothetical protein
MSIELASPEDLSPFRETVAHWTTEGYRRIAEQALPATPEGPAAAPLPPQPSAPEDEEARREHLLAEYKAATDNPSNKRIYEARNSGIYKPQFYEWLNGSLPVDSATCINFERFLRLKKLPIPRNPQS